MVEMRIGTTATFSRPSQGITICSCPEYFFTREARARAFPLLLSSHAITGWQEMLRGQGSAAGIILSRGNGREEGFTTRVQ